MKERLEFIKAVAADADTAFVELCRRHGITAKTGYKWVARYEKEGPRGLEDLPPHAKKHPLEVDTETVGRIVKLRRQHPTWGPRKLLLRLAAMEPTRSLPAASTVGLVLKRQGLVLPRRRRQLGHTPLATQPIPMAPNDVWAMDFKGHFSVGGQRCHPFTVTDEASRYALCCQTAHTETEAIVRPLLEECFNIYGLPTFIRSDNGNPFATHTVGGISRLVIWLVQLGVTPVRIEPGKPQQNGKHERFHRTLKQDVPIQNSFDAQQEFFDRFLRVFNEERPHDGLGGCTPAQLYRTSARRPGLLREPEYDTNQTVRIANVTGCVAWKGVDVRVGKLLNKHPVGIRTVGDGITQFSYGPITLGFFDESAPVRILHEALPLRVFEHWDNGI